MKFKIPFIKPTFPASEEIALDYSAILASNWFTNFGPYESKLSLTIADLFSDEVGVTTIANATLGLQAAVEILFKASESKRQVIVPSFTFAAGPEVLIRAGFEPVFIDIEKKTWQPELAQAREYLLQHNDGVAGILLCNSFGVGNTSIGDWEELAREYALPLVVDSAAGFGSLYTSDEKLGMRGDCEVFSMHATKPFAVGEGGLVISRNKDFIGSIREYQNFGFNKDKDIDFIGTNAKLQELNCAIGLRQLKGFEDRLANRRQTFDYYKHALPELTFIENGDLSTVAFAPAAARTSVEAEEIIDSLGAEGVEVRRYYSPLHLQEKLSAKSSRAGKLENTEDIAGRILSLPVHDNMDQNSVDMIISTIKSAIENFHG